MINLYFESKNMNKCLQVCPKYALKGIEFYLVTNKRHKEKMLQTTRKRL